MNQHVCVRTDMADEARSLWLRSTAEQSELSGVIAESKSFDGLELNCIEILDEEGERALNKARGKYYSLTLPTQISRGSQDFPRCALALARLIKVLAGGRCHNVFVAALGNPAISPDALGHCAADHILITRHLKGEIFKKLSPVSLCRPGVLGCSGIESAQQVKKLCELVSPELVIVVDALAGSEPERLCRCIQLSDGGISPGSGVGNDRQELSHNSLGIPVVAVGMPTVIDAAHFGGGEMSGMFVTPRDIDSRVKEAGRLIAYAINLAVHDELSLEDVDALIN